MVGSAKPGTARASDIPNDPSNTPEPKSKANRRP